MSLTIESAAFSHGDEIPAKYCCNGRDISPPLQWQGSPEQTQSLVLIVDDPDAPDPQAPKMTWVHWVLFNIPPSYSALPEAARASMLPPGSGQGVNDWKNAAYGGPCPPTGRHRYFFKLYALDSMLTLAVAPTKGEVEAAMMGHILAQAELIGTYQK